MASGSNYLTTYYAKRIIGDSAATTPDKALLQTGETITGNEWILNQTARYNESPSKKYGILYNYDDSGHDVIEFWGNKPDTNNNNNPIPSVSITLDSGNTEIMGTLDVVESTLLQSTLTVNGTSLFKNTVTIQMASPTLILDSTTSGAVDWTIKNNQGIFTIINSGSGSGTQILGNSVKGWQIDERLYINATIPDSPNYTLYVDGTTYGNNTITSHTDFKCDTTGHGLYLVDSASKTYAGVYDDGSDIWIGATSSTGQHHKGNLYISAGHNGTEGNKSIYISIPANGNATTTHTSYPLVYKDKTGSATKGIYTDANGKTAEMTYSLVADVNASGNASRIAYYSGKNAISSGSIVTDGGYLGSVSYLSINNAHQTDYRLYVNGATYLTDHLYIGRTNSSHIYLINKNWTKGSIPSSQTYSALEFNSNDSANNRVALLEATLDTSGNSQFNIFLVPNIANSTSWSGIVLKKTNEGILTIYNQGNTEVNGRVWIQAGSAAGSNANRLETTAGMPGNMQYNQSRRGTQIYANGIAFADPYNGNSNNDAGWIRQIETTASSGYLEIATGDDGSEPIYVRQYKTDNTIARTFTLLDGSGNSSIPGHVDMPNETSIKFKIARKKANGGGWAYNPIQIRGNDDAIFSRWGVYGGGNDLSYIFFGVGDYNTTTHIRIDSSGHLVIPNDGIYYQGTKEKYRMIRFIDNTADTYGNGISIGGGGLSIFGSGESADTMVANLGYSGGSEVTVIASDGSILFYPGNNSYDASAKIEMTAGRIWAGVSGNTTRENQVGVQSGAGQLYLWSAAATNGDRGLYLPAHGTGGAFAILRANTNNSITILGNDVWGSSVRLVDNWVGFYNARQGGTRYGYIQANADRMYFRKENGVSSYAFDFNGYIYTNSNIYATGTMYADGSMSAHGIWANRASGERQVGVDAGTTGTLYLYSNGTNKGIYSGSGYRTGAVLTINSSSTTFYGALSGNASTATKASGLADGSSTMTSAYNKAGLNYGDYTWLAGWNGYELRAVNKSQFCKAVDMNGTGRNLQVRYGTKQGVAWGTQTSITFSSAFSNACLAVIPYSSHLGFAAGQSINVGNISKTGFTIYQYNTGGSSVACTLSYVAIGY